MTVRRAAWMAVVPLLLAGCASPVVPIVAPARAGPNGHQLVSIPAGTWQVGVSGHAQNPRRKAVLKEFRISDAETSNEQFAKFVEATGYVTDAGKRGYGLAAREGMKEWEWAEVQGASWRAPFGPDGKKAADLPNHPVTQISGADAEAYCKWIGGRLPTIEEWEVAARAGARTKWPWGATFDPKRANVWNGETHAKNTMLDGWLYTSPIRSFPPNAWGLYDVIGNVFEYCEGMPPGYSAEQAERLIAGRGGSWWCSEKSCNFYNLEDVGTMVRSGSLANQGFRVVFDP